MTSRRLIAVGFLLVAFLSLAAGGGAAGTSAVPQIAAAESVDIVLQPLLSGLDSPIFVTNAHDGSNRLFVVEQPGRIKVLQPGASTPTVFLDITSRVLSGGERGLLGLAFHPQFSANRRFFVNYTRQSDGATVIAEYRASASNTNVADTTETVLLVIAQPFSNHNGGMIEFGPDQFLYIGMGDGGSANDPGNRAQNITDLLGKILRIDVDHANGGVAYSSPSDNPFFGATAGRDEIYAYGMRNPWRFSFDRVTGQLYAGDVGQNAREEIDIVTRGGNYGWRVMEGNICNPSFNGGACTPIGVGPVAEYTHSGGRCSVTGGYVYRGSQSSLPVGTYVYADFCTGEIFMLSGGATSLLLDTSMSISSFGEDEAGEIYVVDIEGTVNRLANPNPPPPPSDTLIIERALVRRRSNNEVLQPITVKSNGKKYEVVLFGSGFVEDSRIFVNGKKLSTHLENTVFETTILIGRLKMNMLAAPGPLVVEFENPNDARSNQFTLQVVPD
ncbi:MAG: PQQ-dependent sugar dehydrogenase [Acidobacteriota bacterium]